MLVLRYCKSWALTELSEQTPSGPVATKYPMLNHFGYELEDAILNNQCHPRRVPSCTCLRELEWWKIIDCWNRINTALLKTADKAHSLA
jgi:hypothetical protein